MPSIKRVVQSPPLLILIGFDLILLLLVVFDGERYKDFLPVVVGLASAIVVLATAQANSEKTRVAAEQAKQEAQEAKERANTEAQSFITHYAEESKGEIAALRSENAALSEKLDAIARRLEEATSKLATAQGQVEAQRTEIDGLCRRVQEMEATQHRMTREREAVDSELQIEREKSARLDRELMAARGRISTLETDAVKQRDESARRISELEVKVSQLQAQLDATKEAQASIIMPLVDMMKKAISPELKEEVA